MTERIRNRHDSNTGEDGGGGGKLTTITTGTFRSHPRASSLKDEEEIIIQD